MKPKIKLSAVVLVILSPLFSNVGCKRGASINKSGYILGPTNEIETFDDKKSNSVAKESFEGTALVSTLLSNKKRKFCSGSLIKYQSELRLLTNFHCFASIGKSGEINNKFIPEACEQTHVYFHFAKSNHNDVVIGKCKSGTLIGDNEGDIATFELESNPPGFVRPFELWDNLEIPDQREAFIIHYPDVKENFEEINDSGISLPAASITRSDCKILGDFQTDEWPLDSTLPFSFKHTCDLVHGSSGSPLIDAQTGKLLGVNWGGIEMRYKDRTEKVNAATKSIYVTSFLDGKFDSIKEDSHQKSAEAERKLQAEQKHKDSKLELGRWCGSIGKESINKHSPTELIIFLLLLAIPIPLGICRACNSENAKSPSQI